jgi:hypothetical protein
MPRISGVLRGRLSSRIEMPDLLRREIPNINALQIHIADLLEDLAAERMVLQGALDAAMLDAGSGHGRADRAEAVRDGERAFGHSFRFAVRINQMPGGPIIAQRQETHLPVIADDAMEQTSDPLNRGRKMRRETMKTMLLAAAAALSLGVGSAYADSGDGPAANTFFTELPGVVAQADVPNAPTYAQNGQATQQAQNGQGTHSTQSGRGPWLFPPLSKYFPGTNS